MRGPALSSVCTCHSLTSLSSVLAWMCVLATHSSCRLPCGACTPGCQGLTLVHFSARCKHFLWDRGFVSGLFGVVQGVFGV